MTPTPTPPCLGEREAVARTIRKAMRGTCTSEGGADIVVSGLVEPLRTENETLRAEREQSEKHRNDLMDSIVSLKTERGALRTRLAAVEAERDAAIARAEEAERRVGDLSATLTAWEGAFGTIQSHLQDRIAMNDPARPDVYLRIVEGSVGELPRISRQIYAATQYRSQSTQAYANRVDLENETLTAKLAQAEGEIATMRGVLKRLGAFKPFKPFGSFYDELSARRNFARAALTTPEHPHGD